MCRAKGTTIRRAPSAADHFLEYDIVILYIVLSYTFFFVIRVHTCIYRFYFLSLLFIIIIKNDVPDTTIEDEEAITQCIIL